MRIWDPAVWRRLSVTKAAVLIAMICGVVLAGCATNVSRFQMPGTDLSTIRAFVVSAPGDDPAEQELYDLIRAELEERGYTVSEEEEEEDEEPILDEQTKRFEYAPDWHWDITTYLLELRLAIYEPSDDTLIVQSQSLQSSLVRQDVNTVVERAMSQLFNDPQPETGER